MGLDQYMYRITKPKGIRKNRVYEREDTILNQCVIVDSDEIDTDMYVALKPFMVTIKMITSRINIDKIRQDFNLSDKAYIGSLYGSEYHIYDKENEDTNVVISDTKMRNEYTTISYTDVYVGKCEQLYYWRKNYEISDFLNEEFTNLENCGFYPIDRTLAEYLQDIDGKINPLDFPEANSNIMYHEWY